MTVTGAFEKLIADAQLVPLQRPAMIDLTATEAPETIVVPDSAMTLLEEYELYVD
jgi:hypothetical protein